MNHPHPRHSHHYHPGDGDSRMHRTTTATTMLPRQDSGNSNSNSNNRLEWFWTCIRFCNTFAVTILSVCVVWIFLQLQYITYALHQESDRIDSLLQEMEQKQSEQFQDLDQKVQNNHSLTLYQMAGTFTLLTGLLTMYHMYTHLRNYHEPIVQRRIVTILWMSPIYSVTAFLALVFPAADGYLGIIRDFYEAYCVYNFLGLLIAILGRGDREAVVTVLAQHANHLKPPTSCLKSCYHPPPETSDQAMANAVLYECQVLAMQFVFCRPLTSIASFVSFTLMQSHADLNHDEQDPWLFFKTPGFYIAMVTNLSVFLAFTGLLKFYHAVHQDLLWCQPFSKFMAIKGIVFLTFWQGLLIAIFVSLQQHARKGDDDNSNNTGKTAQEQALEIQHILICLEMVFFSIAHLCVFPADEWEPNYRPKEMQAPSLGIQDFAKDVKFIMTSTRRQRRMDDDKNNAAAAAAAALSEEELAMTLSCSDENDDKNNNSGDGKDKNGVGVNKPFSMAKSLPRKERHNETDPLAAAPSSILSPRRRDDYHGEHPFV